VLQCVVVLRVVVHVSGYVTVRLIGVDGSNVFGRLECTLQCCGLQCLLQCVLQCELQ